MMNNNWTTRRKRSIKLLVGCFLTVGSTFNALRFSRRQLFLVTEENQFEEADLFDENGNNNDDDYTSSSSPLVPSSSAGANSDRGTSRSEKFESESLISTSTIRSSSSSSHNLNTAKDDNTQSEYPFTFSACVIARDDNILLPEWIAYHYTVLPLRHLVLGVDPLSITSPARTVALFREHLPSLQIDVWTSNSYWAYDGQWYRERLANFNPYNHTKEHGHWMHRHRQKVFYTQCLRHLKNNSEADWTVLIDTDEYFTYNAPLQSEVEMKLLEEVKKKAKLVKMKKKHKDKDSHQDKQQQHQEQGGLLQFQFQFRSSLPKKIGRQNETIAHWISGYMSNTTTASSTLPPVIRNKTLCLVQPRLFFSARDDAFVNTTSTTTADAKSRLGTSIQLINNEDSIQRFNTIRFQSHGKSKKATPGKSIVQLQNYQLHKLVDNPHSPFPRQCDTEVFQSIQQPPEKNTPPFRIHHYSGSLENWLSRPSRSVEGWEHRNTLVVEGQDTSITLWYEHFIDLIPLTSGDADDDDRRKRKEVIARKLTLEAQDIAYQEWKTIRDKVEQAKQQLNNNNHNGGSDETYAVASIIPLAFPWSEPGVWEGNVL